MKKYLAITTIGLAVLATYLPAVRNGFVWDDTALILRDPLIRSWRLAPEAFNHFLFVDATASDFYRPLQRLTYTLDYAAFAFRPALYHLTSILCQMAAAIALLFFAEELLATLGLTGSRGRWIALIAALVWTVHPVQNAAVIYVSGRADPLAATFGFLGCFLMLRSLRAERSASLLWAIGAALAFLLSALSKETGLIFLVLALVIFALQKKWSAFLKMTVATVFVAAVYLSLRLAAEHDPAPTLTAPPPWMARPITMARAIAEYTGLLVFPLNLHMERQLDATSASVEQPSPAAWRELQTLLGLTLAAAFGWWIVRARKRDPTVFALLILTVVTYLPVSGVLALNASIAEHWLYLPSAFLFLAVAVYIFRFLEAHETRRLAFVGTSIALASWTLFLSVRTFFHTFDWKDQRTFLARTIAHGGDSARMFINLGGLELSEGRLDLAKKHLNTALKKEPGHPLALINLANVAVKENDFKQAREILTRTTKLEPVNAQAHELLAILEKKESGNTNLLRLRLATRTGAPNWGIEKRYITYLDQSGSRPAAIRELRACLQNQWYRADSWRLLSELLAKSGQEKEAAVALAYAKTYDVHLGEHRSLF